MGIINRHSFGERAEQDGSSFKSVLTSGILYRK
jgi:hypothetical protein